MAILKQNGISGKILRAQQSGKVLKQNYNFGNSFTKGVSTNCYIECPYLPNIMQPFTFISWLDASIVDPKTEAAFFLLKNENNASPLTASSFLSNGTIYLSETNVWNGGTGWNTLVSLPSLKNKKMVSLVSDAINVKLGVSNVFANSSKIVSQLKTGSITNHFVGIGNISSLKYTQGKIDDYMVYDRSLPDAELSYIYNNSIGNEMLSIFGLKVYYKFDFAEILSYNGVDHVCVRDFSGNENHGRIIGLPAGTLSEQLIHANSNLFKSW